MYKSCLLLVSKFSTNALPGLTCVSWYDFFLNFVVFRHVLELVAQSMSFVCSHLTWMRPRTLSGRTWLAISPSWTVCSPTPTATKTSRSLLPSCLPLLLWDWAGIPRILNVRVYDFVHYNMMSLLHHQFPQLLWMRCFAALWLVSLVTMATQTPYRRPRSVSVTTVQEVHLSRLTSRQLSSQPALLMEMAQLLINSSRLVNHILYM